jgi:hypothetical protein
MERYPKILSSALCTVRAIKVAVKRSMSGIVCVSPVPYRMPVR